MDEVRYLDGTPLAVLRGFLQQHVPAAAGADLAPDTDLLGSGLLDSLAVLQLMEHLASTYGIEIDDEDFSVDNLATVASLADFIARKTGRG